MKNLEASVVKITDYVVHCMEYHNKRNQHQNSLALAEEFREWFDQDNFQLMYLDYIGEQK